MRESFATTSSRCLAVTVTVPVFLPHRHDLVHHGPGDIVTGKVKDLPYVIWLQIFTDPQANGADDVIIEHSSSPGHQAGQGNRRDT